MWEAILRWWSSRGSQTGINTWKQYALGAFDCLRYPFRTGELRWVVNRALQSGEF